MLLLDCESGAYMIQDDLQQYINPNAAIQSGSERVTFFVNICEVTAQKNVFDIAEMSCKGY